MNPKLILLSLCLLLAGCASSGQELRQKEAEIQSLTGQLSEKEKKIEELTKQLNALRPPAMREAVSVTEVVAVQEEYVGKEILMEGVLPYDFTLHKPITSFYLRGVRGAVMIYCYFETQQLHPTSRRILASKKLHETVGVRGRLLKASESLVFKVHHYPREGFVFHVNKVEY